MHTGKLEPAIVLDNKLGTYVWKRNNHISTINASIWLIKNCALRLK